MEMSIRILHIRDSSGLYGAERVILNLFASATKEDDMNNVLLSISPLEERNLFLKEVKKNGGTIIDFPIQNPINISAIFKMRKIIQNFNPDVIHSHDFKSNFYAILATLGTKTPKVVTAHGATKDSLKKRFYLFLDKNVFYRYFTKIFAVSYELYQDIKKKYGPEKVMYIPNGIDSSTFQNIYEKKMKINNEKKIIIGVIGRLFADKGHYIFLKAFEKIVEECPNVEAWIVGDGPLYTDLKKKIHQLRLEKQAILKGYIENMSRVYESLDILVMPSFREGLPYTLLESVMAGVPVIATNVGDIPRIITHNYSGFLVPPGDVSVLSKYLKKMIEMPQKRKEFARNARENVVMNLNSKKMAEGIFAIYKSLKRKE